FTPAKLSAGVAGRVIVILKVLLTVVPALSDAETVMLAGPAAVGAPEMTPAAESVRPAGRPGADQVTGVTPPLGAQVSASRGPTAQVGMPAVVIASGAAATYNVNVAEAVAPVLSFPVTLKGNVPVVEGAPLLPPAELAVRSDGRPVTVHVYGET